MKQYIERDAVIARKREYNLGGSYDNTEFAVPLDAILSVPAANVRPVVRGTWGHRWYCSNMSGYEYACSCSVCGDPTYRMSLLEKMPNFCPNCGAEMR